MINYNTAIPYLIGIYSEEEQLIKTAEETAELAQAAIKHRHSLISNDAESKSKSRQHLAEEIADVLIMIEQITYAEGFEDDVCEIIDEKIQRQLDRIKGGESMKIFFIIAGIFALAIVLACVRVSDNKRK